MSHIQTRLSQWLVPGTEGIGEAASTEAGMVAADGAATVVLETPDDAGGDKAPDLNPVEPVTEVEAVVEGGMPAAVGITDIGGTVVVTPVVEEVSATLEPVVGKAEKSEDGDIGKADDVLSDAAAPSEPVDGNVVISNEEIGTGTGVTADTTPSATVALEPGAIEEPSAPATPVLEEATIPAKPAEEVVISNEDIDPNAVAASMTAAVVAVLAPGAIEEPTTPATQVVPSNEDIDDSAPQGLPATDALNPEAGTAVVAPGATSDAPVVAEVPAELPASDPAPATEDQGVVVAIPTVPVAVADSTIVAAQVSNVVSDIHDLTDTSVALEGFREIMRTSLATGGLTDPTAQAIRIGLKAVDSSFGGNRIVPGIEAFGQTRSRLSTTARALEDLEAGQVDVQTALMNAIATAKSKAAELKTTAEGDVASLLVFLDQLDNRANNLAEIEFDTTVQLSSNLSVSGAFVGADPRAVLDIKDIAEFFSESYPKQALSIAKNLAGAIEDYRKSVDAEKEEAGRGALLTVLLTLGKNGFNKLPETQECISSDQDSCMSIPVDTSKLLAGDFVLTRARLELDQIQGVDINQAATHLVDSFQVCFERCESAVQAGDAYRLPSVADIKAILKAIKSTLGVVTKVINGLGQIVDVIETLQGTVADTAAINAAGYNVVAFDAATIRGRAINALVAPHVQFIGYAIDSLREFANVAAFNIEAYEIRLREQAALEDHSEK